MSVQYYLLDLGYDVELWKPVPEKISVDELTEEEFVFISEHTHFLEKVRKICELVKEDVVSIIVSRDGCRTDFFLEVYGQRFDYNCSDTRREYLVNNDEFSLKCHTCYTNMDVVKKILNLLERVI